MQQRTKPGELVKSYRRTGKLAISASEKTEAITLNIAKSSGGDTMAKVNANINTSHCLYGIDRPGGYLAVKAIWPSRMKDMVCCKVVNADGVEEVITVSRYQKFDFFLGD
jgi:hypothetical protein